VEQPGEKCDEQKDYKEQRNARRARAKPNGGLAGFVQE
jgi:hypothetical protein